MADYQLQIDTLGIKTLIPLPDGEASRFIDQNFTLLSGIAQRSLLFTPDTPEPGSITIVNSQGATAIDFDNLDLNHVNTMRANRAEVTELFAAEGILYFTGGSMLEGAPDGLTYTKANGNQIDLLATAGSSLVIGGLVNSSAPVTCPDGSTLTLDFQDVSLNAFVLQASTTVVAPSFIFSSGLTLTTAGGRLLVTDTNSESNPAIAVTGLLEEGDTTFVFSLPTSVTDLQFNNRVLQGINSLNAEYVTANLVSFGSSGAALRYDDNLAALIFVDPASGENRTITTTSTPYSGTYNPPGGGEIVIENGLIVSVA